MPAYLPISEVMYTYFSELYYDVLTPQVREIVGWLMANESFDGYALSGGTALSLMFGHRSVDVVEMAAKEPIDCDAIEESLMAQFPYCVQHQPKEYIHNGVSFLVGENEAERVELRFYSAPLNNPTYTVDALRIVAERDIAAVKMDVITHQRRKRDFWDIYELMKCLGARRVIDAYLEAYPNGVSAAECEKLVVDFSRADNEPNPVGCRYNNWQMIKLHIWESVLELDASIKRYVVARSYPEDPLVDLIRQNKVGL